MRDVTIPAPGDPSARQITGPSLAVGAVVAIGLVAAYAARSRWGLGGLAVAATGLGAATVAVGVAVHRPPRSTSWSLLAVGCAVQTVATAVLVADPAAAADGPGLSQTIAVLAYPALFVGAAGITSRRPSGWWVTPSTAIAAALVGSVLTGLAFALPYVRHGRLPFADSDWIGALALGDIALAVIVVRRVLGASHRNWSRWLLVAGFVAWGNAHAEVGERLYGGVYDNGSGWALTLAAGPLLVGAAALVPSMAEPPAARPGEARRAAVVSWGWMLTLPPVVVLLAGVAGLDAARLWVVGPLVVVLAIAVRRTAGLVGELDDPLGLAESTDPVRQ